MEMLQESLREIQGQEIPQVEDTQIDLKLTAFIPTDYIPDPDQKMSAYRAVATANSKEELVADSSRLERSLWSSSYRCPIYVTGDGTQTGSEVLRIQPH